MRECVLVLKDRIIPLVPESNPLRAELQAIVDDVFLELPEDGRIWRLAYLKIGKSLPLDAKDNEQWHRDIIQIWKEETSGS